MMQIATILALALFAFPAFAAPAWWTALHGQYLTEQELAQVTFPQAPVAQPVPVKTSVPVAAPAPPAPLPSTSTSCSKPASFYAAGVSLNRAATPNIAGIFAVAVPLTCDSNSFQVYSYTEHQIIPMGSGKNLTFQDATTSGFAIPLKQIGPINVFAFGNIGVQTNGTAAQLASSYGGFAAFPLWRGSAWTGVIAAQKVSGTNIYGALIGREF